MKADKKKKPRGVKHRIRERRKKEERKSLLLTVGILIIIIFIFGFLINSMLNQPSTSQPANSTSEPKAAIADQLSLTYPNQTFIQTATNTLKQTGYSVDYYPSGNVTVEFYRNLPSHDYGVMLLRVHSAGHNVNGNVELALFTSEPYSSTRYVYEQLTGQIGKVEYSPDSKETYLGITPAFVRQGMKGGFKDALIIMMGCDGLAGTQMAEAFVARGAKVYISWSDLVLESRTEQATIHLLQHFLIEKQAIKQAIMETNNQVGPDPTYNSQLLYYPLEAGDYSIRNIIGSQVIVSTIVEIKHKEFSGIDYHEIT